MKAIALGLHRYLKDKWNQLDVAIVFFSIIGIILEEMESTLIPINPTIIRVMRVARIARVLKLLKMAKGIRQLLDTVMQALPQVGNLGLLFFLLFFIFAALGTELFGRLGLLICLVFNQGLILLFFRMRRRASLPGSWRTCSFSTLWHGLSDALSCRYGRQLEWHYEGLFFQIT